MAAFVAFVTAWRKKVEKSLAISQATSNALIYIIAILTQHGK